MHAKFQKIATLIAALVVVVIIVGLVIHYGIIIAKVRLPKEAELGAVLNRTNEFSFIPPKGETWEILLAARNPSVLTQNLAGVVQVLSDNEPPRTISFTQEELHEANWLSRHGLSSRIVTWKSNNKDLFRPGVTHKVILTLDNSPSPGLSLWVSYHERWKPRLVDDKKEKAVTHKR